MARFQTVLKSARFVYSPYSATEMQGFAQALTDSIRVRIQSGQNIYDQAAAPLKPGQSGRRGYPDYKAARGLRPVRDWTWSGHTLRCLVRSDYKFPTNRASSPTAERTTSLGDDPMGNESSVVEPLEVGCDPALTGAPAPTNPAQRSAPSWGGPLAESDYEALAKSWITRELADQAMLRRVDAQQGREAIGQKGNRDCAGILIPLYGPNAPYPHAYRLRRDNPEWKQGKDGALKPDRKYLGEPGSGNRIYFPPGVSLAQLADPATPIVIVEGEKKALALQRLAYHDVENPRFIPVAIAGVWNWRGTVGKTGGPRGERVDIKGPINDLNLIVWSGRTVFILFDANVATNDSVKWARKGISRELATRRAEVRCINLPEDCGVNGVDDLLFAWGPVRVLELFEKTTSGTTLQVVRTPQFQSKPEGMFAGQPKRRRGARPKRRTPSRTRQVPRSRHPLSSNKPTAPSKDPPDLWKRQESADHLQYG